MSEKRKPKNVFVDGPISPQKIADSISHHQVKTNIGAHDIFLGQVRADEVDGKIVQAIDYTAHEEMANKAFYDIREATFEKFDVTCLHIYHSLGIVNIGELCLFVFTSSAHRKECMDATRFIVEEIKTKVPVFGKIILKDESFLWKENN